MARPRVGAPRRAGKEAVAAPVSEVMRSRRTTRSGIIVPVLCGLALAAAAAGAAPTEECVPPVIRSSEGGSAKDVVVAAEVTRIRLPLPADAHSSPTELVLRDIRFDEHPGTQFHVRLETGADPAEPARVGTLSFYMPLPAGGTTTRTFDVTDAFRRLAAATPGLASVDVVLEATSGLGGANGEASFDSDTKLTIGEVVLRGKEE